MPSSPRMRSSWEPAERALKKASERQRGCPLALAEAGRRFDDVVRPPPPRTSPTPLLLTLGLLALIGVAQLWRRAQKGELSGPLRGSLPAYRWVAHAVIAVGLLVIFPIAVGAGTAFFAGPQGDMHFVGLANFVEILTARGAPLLSSGSFYLVLLVTLLWTVANVTLHVAIGFAARARALAARARAAAALPCALDRALGRAVVRDGSGLEGHVQPPVRRGQRPVRSAGASSRSRGGRASPRPSPPTWPPTSGSAFRS